MPLELFRPPMVGLDIGSGAVKGVSLKKTRTGWSLVAAAEVPVAYTPGASEHQSVTDAAVADSVSDCFDALRLRRARVATALSGHAVIVKRLSMPSMSRAELAEAISWEAEQYIPFDLADVQLDYQVMTSPADAGKSTVDVLLVAAKKERIDDRSALVAQAGRQPVVLDVEAFALANAYKINYPERTDPTTALVHVGRNATLVCLLEQGEPTFTRDIALGGQAHVDALLRDPVTKGLDELALKRILHGNMPPGADGEHVAKVLHEASASLVREVRKTIEFFQTSSPVERLSRVILSGGAWEAAGLVDLLTSEFSAPVDVFDPFRRIARPAKALGGDAVGPSYAVAVGLAMRSEGDR
jgi:type IV pilus assembly protein PilM